MKKVLITISLFSILLMMGVVTSAHQIMRNDGGDFKASLGLKGEARILFTLDGNFRYRGRICIVRGPCETIKENGRFFGIFLGNSFYIKVPVDGRPTLLIGQIRFKDDQHLEFSGTWESRIFCDTGAIAGEFIL